MSVCANCSSTASVGTEIAAVCTECGTAAVAGASFTPMTMLAMGIIAGGLYCAAKAIRRLSWRLPRLSAS